MTLFIIKVKARKDFDIWLRFGKIFPVFRDIRRQARGE
jgi:hypothetical protein